MLKVDLEKEGVVAVSGPMDIILTEFTVLTKMILRHLTEEYGEEKAFQLFAKIGQNAANTEMHPNKIQDLTTETMKEVLLDNEV